MTEYWRIRHKQGEAGDVTKRAWERDEVGIWYGGWSAEEFDPERSLPQKNDVVAARLTMLDSHRPLRWPVTRQYVDTVKRFWRISQEDWVVVYLPNEQEIGLAKACSTPRSSLDHPINLEGEVFKFRSIHQKKTFKVKDLPDAFWLLSSQGRGNVHKFIAMKNHIVLLAQASNAEELKAMLRGKSFVEILDLLGAAGWESFCYAYLTLEHGYVPTGLSIGRTLPIVDIIGRNRNRGTRIIGQCKKDNAGVRKQIDPDFLRAVDSLAPDDQAFYFAYGGADPCSILSNGRVEIKIIDREVILRWANTVCGEKYKQWLIGPLA